MRGSEGIAAVRPGTSSRSTWSEGSKNYIRNVEAVGSNPITSTESPGQGLKWDPQCYDSDRLGAGILPRPSEPRPLRSDRADGIGERKTEAVTSGTRQA